MPRLIEVLPLPAYQLRLTYDDGVTGTVDLSALAGHGVFQRWNDPAAFATVSIGSGGEPIWDGQIDLCPDSLYMEITGKRPEEVFPNLARLESHA